MLKKYPTPSIVCSCLKLFLKVIDQILQVLIINMQIVLPKQTTDIFEILLNFYLPIFRLDGSSLAMKTDLISGILTKFESSPSFNNL